MNRFEATPQPENAHNVLLHGGERLRTRSHIIKFTILLSNDNLKG
jgi:hypothetical protein